MIKQNLVFSNWTDQQLYEFAFAKKYSGEYSDAVDALKELHSRGLNGAHAVKGMQLWYSILLDAWFNSPNNDYISQNIESAKDEFIHKMTSNIQMNTPGGRRYHHLSTILKVYSRNFDESLSTLDQLISNTPTNREKLMYLFDKLTIHLHGKNNRSNALNVYQQIADVDSNSVQAVVSRMLLGLPFTKIQWATAFGYPLPSQALMTDVVKKDKEKSDCILYNNQPNPFNPSTTIRFYLMEAGHVRLVVTDVFGKEIKTLFDEVLVEGTYSSHFTGDNLSSGIYYYTLRTKAFRITKPMILLR